MGTCQCLKLLAFCEKFGQSPLKICQPPAPVCKTAPVDQPAAPLVKIRDSSTLNVTLSISSAGWICNLSKRDDGAFQLEG